VYPLVWDYGLRNPWRFSFDRQTGHLFIGDVGQSAWEEIDVEPPLSGQRDYGWPTMEGNHCVTAGCAPVGIAPVIEHSHASGEGGAITGGYVYRGAAIPCLQGHYVYGDSGSRRYWTFQWNGSSAQNPTEITANLAAPQGAMPVSFGEDAAGELHVVMISGEIYRIDPE
jgi:glucose/arabinose dehydrogenase